MHSFPERLSTELLDIYMLKSSVFGLYLLGFKTELFEISNGCPNPLVYQPLCLILTFHDKVFVEKEIVHHLQDLTFALYNNLYLMGNSSKLSRYVVKTLLVIRSQILPRTRC